MNVKIQSGLVLFVACLWVAGCASQQRLGVEVSAADEEAGSTEQATHQPAVVRSGQCTEEPKVVPVKASVDARSRDAAQRGLDFLSEASVKWQKQHGCYGCHVHSVTLEALSIGKKHQYAVEESSMNDIVDGMLNLPGGARNGGFVYRGGQLSAPSKAFGGAAFARFDEFVDTRLTDDMLEAAAELLKFQQSSGMVQTGYSNLPVAAGDIHGTYLGIRLWRQAYERSADSKWLEPLHRAEAYLYEQGKRWLKNESFDTQHMNLTLMALVEAGLGSADPVLMGLRNLVVARQGEDGGWALNGQGSSPLATGQSLYALRMAGLGDQDVSIQRGTKWLMDKQQQGGAWSSGGFAKAEAMWAVLGLVSIDVLSLRFASVEDGQRVSGTHPVIVTARDNSGKRVSKTQLYVDDLLVAESCGGDLHYDWDTKALDTGRHTLRIEARNHAGQVSRRTTSVYAGDIFVAGVAAEFDQGGVDFSMRDLAPTGMPHRIKVRIVDAENKEVRTLNEVGRTGTFRLRWDGKDKTGKAVKHGQYRAQVVVIDADDKERQTVDQTVTFERPEVQRKEYSQIEGRLAFEDDVLENTEVVLEDEEGNVVERTKTTRSGMYRFKNVKKGKYRVRAKKKGFSAKPREVEAAPAASQSVDFEMNQ